VTGDWEKEYSSVLRFLQLFPRDVYAHQNLASAFLHLGQPGHAADEATETARLQPSSYYFGTAIESCRVASRFIEAKSWLDKADALKFDNSKIRHERLLVLFATGDRDGVAKILAEGERGCDRRDVLLNHSLIETHQGRFGSAERLRLQAFEDPSKTTNIYWWVIRSALENAEVGRVVQARRYESEADRSKLDPDQKLFLALALARWGQTEEAGKLAGPNQRGKTRRHARAELPRPHNPGRDQAAAARSGGCHRSSPRDCQVPPAACRVKRTG
jgi:tetratricopeptide (TPR) repeat protein